MMHRQASLSLRTKIKAEPENVFSAFTNPDLLLMWWPTQVEIDLREGGGFKMSFLPYSDSVEKGQFLRIISGQLLKYTAASSDFPNVAREVTIEFKPQGEHTQVVLTEAGWRQGRLWEKLHRSGEDGWRGILRDLKIFVESGNDPRSGRKPKLAKPERARPGGRLVIRQKYYYKVRPKRVFQALTVPDRLTKWLLREAEVEFRKMGKMKMIWNDGYAQECKILELELNKRLTLSWPSNGWAGAPQANTTVRLTFTPAGDEHTVLELEHTGFGTGENWARYYGATYSGWTYYLLNLKSVLEHGIDLRDEIGESVNLEPEKTETVKETEEDDKIAI
jgi:uncharacterized protein YndB with AHSA1/START domain